MIVPTKDLEENFRILRVSIEEQVDLPAVITVTSALPGDGTGYVARGVAYAFAEAGYQTSLIEAGMLDRGICDADENRTHANDPELDLIHSMSFDTLSVKSLKSLASDFRGDVAGLLSKLRALYRVIVVEADPIPSSGLGLSFARKSDAILLSVKLGRRPDPADEILQQLLKRGRAKLMGVVPTVPSKATRIFGSRNAKAKEGVIRPRRAPISV